MPLKSQSQLRRFGELVKEGKMSKAEFDRWIADTPDIKNLPERIGPQKPTTIIRKAKIIK